MELQLGLALPTTPPISNGFDLNNFVYESANMGHHHKDQFATCRTVIDGNKRSFAQAFDETTTKASAAVPRTLPLLLWNNQQDDDDDDDDDSPNEHQPGNPSFTNVIKNDEEGSVGWPPINSWRRESCFHSYGGHRTVGRNGCGGRSSFVKVKMEGVGIARKVDVSRHHSFESLVDTLMDMFDKCQEDSKNYKLTYQDAEGDWLLAHQDVPWRTFIRSVQRLRLLRRSGSGR